MLQLIYRSVAAPGIDAGVAARISEYSRQRNRSLEITGVLLFDQRNFVQVLEGGTNIVDLVFGQIQKDDRHSDVTLLSRIEKLERSFPYWSMQLSVVRTAYFEQPPWQNPQFDAASPRFGKAISDVFRYQNRTELAQFEGRAV